MAGKEHIPDDMTSLFEEAAVGHLSYVNDADRIINFPMWIGYDGERILTTSRMGSAKGRSLRERPSVGLSVVSLDNPDRWLSISGRVTDITRDEGLALTDTLAHRYTGRDYEDRQPREVFHVAIDRVTASPGSW